MPHFESPRHVELRNKVANILTTSGFQTDRIVHIRTSTRQTDLDVCALYQEVLIVVECKTGTNVHYENLLSELKQKIADIVNEKSALTILGSYDQVVTRQRLACIETVKVAIAFRDYRPSPTQIEQARVSYEIGILDCDAIEYYQRTSKALGSWTKYEIFRDFDIRRGEQGETAEVPALRIRQPAAELYVFALPPHKLLRIAYVFRRSLKESYAYQRMIKQRKIERIADFLRREGAFLPNAILLAFGDEVTDRVTFEPPDADVGKLRIPLEYCSSWIVDGQHRLYGFARTPFSEPPADSPEVQPRFDLLVVGLKDLGQEQQAKTFVDVNDNQTRIDSTLLCDLTTLIKDPRHPLTWPSLLVKELNNQAPWKDRIRILEIERNKPITLVGFAKWALLNELLGRREQRDGTIKYVGPLFRHAGFDYTHDLNYQPNKEALRKQTALLVRYFLALKRTTDSVSTDIWNNPIFYGITKSTGVNASLLVLSRLMDQRPDLDIDLASYLAPLGDLPFTNSWIARFGGGWKGFKALANRMIRLLNSRNKKTGIRLAKY